MLSRRAMSAKFVWRTTKTIDREKIRKENAAYNELVAAGYLPQGINRRGKCAVGKTLKYGCVDILWEFDSWQEAVHYLINK